MVAQHPTVKDEKRLEKKYFSQKSISCPAHFSVFSAPRTPGWTNRLILDILEVEGVELGVLEQGKQSNVAGLGVLQD